MQIIASTLFLANLKGTPWKQVVKFGDFLCFGLQSTKPGKHAQKQLSNFNFHLFSGFKLYICVGTPCCFTTSRCYYRCVWTGWASSTLLFVQMWCLAVINQGLTSGDNSLRNTSNTLFSFESLFTIFHSTTSWTELKSLFSDLSSVTICPTKAINMVV